MYLAISCRTDFKLPTLRLTQTAVSAQSRFSLHTTQGTYSTYTGYT